jgi:hypothetical protein
MSVPRRVGLGLEEGVEVPEGRLDPLVRRHLREAHGQQDLAELSTDLSEGGEGGTTGARGKEKKAGKRVDECRGGDKGEEEREGEREAGREDGLQGSTMGTGP